MLEHNQSYSEAPEADQLAIAPHQEQHLYSFPATPDQVGTGWMMKMSWYIHRLFQRKGLEVA